MITSQSISRVIASLQSVDEKPYHIDVNYDVWQRIGEQRIIDDVKIHYDDRLEKGEYMVVFTESMDGYVIRESSFIERVFRPIVILLMQFKMWYNRE